jgi:hypothetical protein
MTNFIWNGLFLTCICAVFMVIGATDTFAYGTYEAGCITCHTEAQFKGPGTPLHNLHNTFVSTCKRCHIKNGDNPVTSLTADTPDRGCVGCHGRSEDAGNDTFPGGLGAGLRQHHDNSGISSCAVCHTDANPSNYTPVGEDVFPPFYVAEGLYPCTDLLDNDGDLDYDGADPDCIQIIDTDSDGVPDNEDNCPSTWNPNQNDSDGDSIGDWCDSCPNDSTNDGSDGDGICDDVDNCIGTSNPNQDDVDTDGDGDVCDADTIYGTISGDIQAGVTVALYIVNCGGNLDGGSPVTNSEGYYAIGDLVDGQYQVIPQEAGYSFAPVSAWSYIPNGPDQPKDFTSTAD